MSQSLKHSKNYHNLLDNVIENELTLNTKPNNEGLWVKMGSQLEIEEIPSHRISTIMKKDIEDKLYENQSKDFKNYTPRKEYSWHSGHYFEVVSRNGWTNPKMARIAPGQEQYNSSINTLNNNNMLVICDDIINICRYIKEKALDAKPLENIFGEKEMKEFYKQRKSMMKNCKNVIDEKTKVPTNTELFLLESLSTVLGNTHKCAEVFQHVVMNHMEEQGKFLTSKQAHKYQNGDKQSKLNIFKPIERDSALFAEYTGIQCTCESWRVRENPNTNSLECYDCEKVFPKQHIPKCNNCQIPLFKERIKHIVDTGKCENCEYKVDLPDEIRQYVNT